MTKFFVLMITLILLFTVLITRMFFFPFSKPSLIFTLREVRGQAGACVNFCLLFIILPVRLILWPVVGGHLCYFLLIFKLTVQYRVPLFLNVIGTPGCAHKIAFC